MALVQMKCPNCGGNMQPQNCGSSFRCPHCGTTVLNIVDAKLDSDVTIMTPEEFERQANQNTKSLIVKIDEKIEEVDVDTTVINAKIKQARQYLNYGKWEKVLEVFSDNLANSLKRKWEDIPSVNRLILLSYFKVKDESELLLRSLKLDQGYNGFGNVFEKIVNSPLCDQNTKYTYQLIEQECRKNCEIDDEISEGHKLLEVGAEAQFIAYAKSMCNKYPYKTKSWFLLAEAYKGNKERLYEIYEIIKRCPDFYLWHDTVISECKRSKSEDDLVIGSSCKITGILKNIIYYNDEKVIEENEKIREKKEVEDRRERSRTVFIRLLSTIPLMALLCVALWEYPKSFRDEYNKFSMYEYNEVLLLVLCIIFIVLIVALAITMLLMIFLPHKYWRRYDYNILTFDFVLKIIIPVVFVIDFILYAVQMIFFAR